MKNIKLNDILTIISARNYKGNKDLFITELLDLLNETPKAGEQLFWCNDKNLNKLNNLTGGTVIVSEENFFSVQNTNLNVIAVEKPRLAFKIVLEKYFVIPRPKNHISENSFVHATAKIGQNVFIGRNVIIEEACIIGNNCFIGHNTVLHSFTILEDNVSIGCNNTIGGVGFGYEKNADEEWEVMPHVGNVIIRSNVEIGNSTCIDRAVIGSTIIGKNVKIDNLVHIAHGVKIDENSLIIANAMIGGSAQIGKNVWFGPSASILNKGVINDEAFIGMSAVVVKPVDANTVVAGNPAKFLRINNNK